MLIITYSLDTELRVLSFIGNTSLEAAVTWIENHENTPDIDEMPLVQQFCLVIRLIIIIIIIMYACTVSQVVYIWQTSVKIRVVHIMNTYTVIKLQSLPSDMIIHSGICGQ